MKVSGEALIPAPRERVWEALNDPEVLKQCIPGCEEIVKKSPSQFEARVVAKVGPVKAKVPEGTIFRVTPDMSLQFEPLMCNSPN
jgi:carbon monoxide dehydrogenase subunit G